LTRRRFVTGSTGFLAAATIGMGRIHSSLLGTPTAGNTPPHRIILDTDPGVDDAIAILLALRSPELKVEAVTPVAGNVPLDFTLPNALKLLELAGRTDIPVAAGASAPLVRSLITARYVHGNNGLGGVELPEPKMQPVKETATEIIRRIVRANPGEISIVAVGPLTNVATALRADPGLIPLIRSIVIMGGSLSGGNITPAAEFNFYVDPEAARIVFDSGAPITMVGLDVTRKVQIGDEQLKVMEGANNKVSQTAARILRGAMERMKKDYGLDAPTMAMHDPLTVAQLIDPGILKLQDYYVLIETSGEATAGQSLGYSRGPVRRSAPLEAGGAAAEVTFHPNAKVGVDVDAPRFLKLLLNRLAATS
jgi:inosine-uridine nucleoside N-ribohydrolase